MPAAASGAAPSPPAPAAPLAIDDLEPYFIAGEHMTWNLTVLGVEGGRARLAVGEPGIVDGRRMVAAVAEAEASGLVALVRKVRDQVASWVDVESGLPARTDSETDFRGRLLRVQALRPAGEALAELLVSRGGGEESRRRLRLPKVRTHDTISAMMALRSWDAPDGARAEMHTLGGLRLWRTSLQVEGREVIDTPLGRRSAVRIQAVSQRLTSTFADDPRPPRTFTLWMSDDPDRIPLRMDIHTEYGSLALRATSYEAP